MRAIVIPALMRFLTNLSSVTASSGSVTIMREENSFLVGPSRSSVRRFSSSTRRSGGTAGDICSGGPPARDSSMILAFCTAALMCEGTASGNCRPRASKRRRVNGVACARTARNARRLRALPRSEGSTAARAARCVCSCMPIRTRSRSSALRRAAICCCVLAMVEYY